jgi:hypothetical protein
MALPVSKPLLFSLAASALALGAIVVGPRVVTGAADEPVAKPVAGIKDVMYTFNEGPHSVVGLLREGFNQSACDEEGWAAIVARATMTVEAGNMLLGMKPPTGADDAAGLAKWKAHVAEYRSQAEEARAAAQKKDLAAGKAAIVALSKKCTACHKDHRKDE